MPRLAHGATITLENVRAAADSMRRRSLDTNESNLAFAAASPSDPTRFDYMFRALQENPANLLPADPATVAALSALGRTMEESGRDQTLDSTIPAAYTYLGQFIDHDITLETQSGGLFPTPGPLTPRSVEDILTSLFNMRTATLDLDSVYGFPAPRVGQKMVIGAVTNLNNPTIPFKRPDGKDDNNDLPREPPSTDVARDRAALTGDPRNDENTIISQLHLAFLKAHNALVDRGHSFGTARMLLRQHYQHMVLHDFLKRTCDPAVVDRVLTYGPTFYDAMTEPFFMPLEFSVAAFRFGHTMVRSAYNFNVNFNFAGGGAPPATIDLLFTFSALSGQLGSFDTLPENWIIEWERFFQDANGTNFARKMDTKLVEPLSQLRNVDGSVITEGPGTGGPPPIHDGARLAVRNLLRGYLLRMPTGQAVATAMGLTPLTGDQLKAAAADPAQAAALENGGFLERTPLWFYLLAEGAHAGGNHLGPVGSTIVAEVFYGLVKRSEDSILRTKGWSATLGATPGQFELADLLHLAGVLKTPVTPGGGSLIGATR